MSFSVCLISLSIIPSRFIYVVTNGKISFFCMAEYIYVNQNFFVHSSIDGHCGLISATVPTIVTKKYNLLRVTTSANQHLSRFSLRTPSGLALRGIAQIYMHQPKWLNYFKSFSNMNSV